jgi:hypothetical protein
MECNLSNAIEIAENAISHCSKVTELDFILLEFARVYALDLDILVLELQLSNNILSGAFGQLTGKDIIEKNVYFDAYKKFFIETENFLKNLESDRFSPGNFNLGPPKQPLNAEISQSNLRYELGSWAPEKYPKNVGEQSKQQLGNLVGGPLLNLSSTSLSESLPKLGEWKPPQKQEESSGESIPTKPATAENMLEDVLRLRSKIVQTYEENLTNIADMFTFGHQIDNIDLNPNILGGMISEKSKEARLKRDILISKVDTYRIELESFL